MFRQQSLNKNQLGFVLFKYENIMSRPFRFDVVFPLSQVL